MAIFADGQMTEEEYRQHWIKYFYSVRQEANRRMAYLRFLASVQNFLICTSWATLIIIVVVAAIRGL